MPGDELLHLLVQQGQRERGNLVFAAYGHIASYDPASHAVRVVLPVQRDDADLPVETPWVPLGAAWVGNGFGIQVAPHGGATPQNPTAGEQCILLVIEQQPGVAAVACLCYTNLMPPPGGLLPGELLVRHESGSSLKFASSGAITLTAPANAPITVQVSGSGTVKVNGGAHPVARVGDTVAFGVITSGSPILLSD